MLIRAVELAHCVKVLGESWITEFDSRDQVQKVSSDLHPGSVVHYVFARVHVCVHTNTYTYTQCKNIQVKNHAALTETGIACTVQYWLPGDDDQTMW